MHSKKLREKFRKFFITHNHTEISSASLIPDKSDPTVLLTTAGMQPLVPYLMGSIHPAGKRLFDTQKCFRTPDIDEVGDDTHHTFFEMLGNWSLGDYFKEEAIELAYDFFANELGLDASKFAITIFKGDKDAPRDDEAEKIWLSKGLKKEQIFEFDKADNFWGPAGETGPCGPCSEIHYDRGEKYGADVGPNSDENQRYVEIWNLVFMEYNKLADGSYEKLKQKNVDTGVGFERLLSILNKKESAFDTDLFANILSKIEELSGKKYKSLLQKPQNHPHSDSFSASSHRGSSQDGSVISTNNPLTTNQKNNSESEKFGALQEAQNSKKSFRIISDHIRGATFLIADGVIPGNTGRDYILRRIIRRAVMHGRKMGILNAFVAKLSEVVISEFSEFYPELSKRKKHIIEVLNIEEKSFEQTLERGEKILSEILEKEGKISGEKAFMLFDTYGFPLELTEEIAEGKVDIDGFKKEMEKQKERSRAGGKNMFRHTEDLSAFENLPATEFLRDTLSAKCKVLYCMGTEEKTCYIALDRTPFYAESGGQIADKGFLGGNEVLSVQKNPNGVFIHKINSTPVSTLLACGCTCDEQNNCSDSPCDTNDEIKALVDPINRQEIARHHSLAHLLQASMRKVLGNHVEQAGSMVSATRTRFDFIHPKNLSKAEIAEIEKNISQWIAQGLESKTEEMPIEEAKKKGAMSLFSDKFSKGQKVRMVSIGDISIELCGGTHIKNSSEIGSIKIISESSVSSGIRRIEMVCSQSAQALLNKHYSLVENLSEQLKCPTDKLEDRTKNTLKDKKNAEYQLKDLKAKFAQVEAKSLVEKAKEIGGMKVVILSSDEEKLNVLSRSLAKEIDLAVIYSKNGSIAVASSKVSAKNILNKLGEKFGGGGGGSENFARGGGFQGLNSEEIEEILTQIK